MTYKKLGIGLMMWLLTYVGFAQQMSSGSNSSTATDTVPRLVHFNGTLQEAGGMSITTIKGVTFSLYKEEQGGTPLWTEIQNVQPDEKGNYSVMLGASKPDGLPLELFASGEARWLGVEIEGQTEQPRVLLLSVPYALKAKDAETLGGQPASAYMLAPKQSPTPSTQAAADANTRPYAGLNVAKKSVLPSIGGGGTAGFLPVWTDASDLGNSVLFQNSAGQIGLGTSSTQGLVGSLTLGATLSFANTSTPLIYNDTAEGKGIIRYSRMFWAYAPQAPTFGIWWNDPANKMIWQTDTNHQFLTADFLNKRVGVGTASPSTALDVNANGLDTLIGNMGCNSGFTGLAFGNSTTTLNCTNYSLLGDGANTYINIPGAPGFGETQPELAFRWQNVDLMDLTTQGEDTLSPLLVLGPQTLAFFNDDYVTNGAGATTVIGDGNCDAGFVGISFFRPGLGANEDCFGYALLGDISIGSTTEGETFLNGSVLHLQGRYACCNVYDVAQAYIDGSVVPQLDVLGNLTKQSGSFKIDHPLDPANKYLYHSFVESPDMMNIYNGVVRLDDKGEATVPLPEWFGSLNRDFRYQLTSIGAPGPNLYIAEEVANNHFKIAGGAPGAKVSWQVTGIRQDAWANAHRIPVEQEKQGIERGHYLHPELFGKPQEASIQWAHNPGMMQAAKTGRTRKRAPGRLPVRQVQGPHPQAASTGLQKAN